MRLQWLACAALALAAGGAAAQQAISLVRQDQAAVPAIAYPPPAGPCRGVAIVSHGAGGSEKGYRYLGEALAAMGHLAVVVGHAESGRAALFAHTRGRTLREGLAALITDPAAYHGRYLDIAAARHWAAARCSGTESVLVGHSMGAATTLLAAGARNRLGLMAIAAFDAYIALSPQGSGPIFPEQAWSDIRSPVLLLTGTRDDKLGGGTWRARTEAFGSLPAGCTWLGVIDGATHMHFAGNGGSQHTESITVPVIRAFLEGVRRGDCSALPPLAGIDLRSK